MALILTNEQARAVFTSMQALNNADGLLSCLFGANTLVKEQASGFITVYKGPVVRELYESQQHFATAYGMI